MYTFGKILNRHMTLLLHRYYTVAFILGRYFDRQLRFYKVTFYETADSLWN